MKHTPVMLEEAIQYLNINKNGIYVDCTLGGASHSEAILKHLENGHLFAFDQDAYAINATKDKLKKYQGKFTLIHDNFSSITENLHLNGITSVDGVLYDLGVSSHHFDNPERGFSYQHDAMLDMRMDQSKTRTAKEIINTYTQDQLKTILYKYGEESFAPLIAKTIVQSREQKPIETTLELVDIIRIALPNKVLRKKGHPAKQTFQALRIEVNQELEVLQNSLQQALKLLNPSGCIVVISFHSLEDRIVKQIFHQATTIDYPHQLVAMPTITPEFEKLHKKVITPTQIEIDTNNRSHSAKLRAIRKI